MDTKGLIMGLLFAAGGIFSICGAALNWDWFLESRKARFFVNVFGRNGARVIYAVLGAVLVVVGILMALGIVSSERKRKRFSLPHSKLEQPWQSREGEGLVKSPRLPSADYRADATGFAAPAWHPFADHRDALRRRGAQGHLERCPKPGARTDVADATGSRLQAARRSVLEPEYRACRLILQA